MIATYDHRTFLPLEILAKRKRSLGQRVSVVIPALNEAQTIGQIVSAIRFGLLDSYGLVDDICVIDGASSDTTAQAALQAGARVYGIDAIEQDFFAARGKGCALWKSQFVAQGDLIVCVDADICNFDIRFVYGLLGPLLHDESVILTKACYRRPLAVGGAVVQNQGGRITEILVRPVLAAFFPELAHLAQPLSGEYAFRRHAVEEIPFSSGYGVEVGMLIDLYLRHGMRPLAQVDMGTRCHRNRSVAELGRAAFGILQALLRRIERSGAIEIKRPISLAMISPDEDGSGLHEREILEMELPPKKRYGKITIAT